MKTYLKSKIHRATVTGTEIDYIGSITIDQDLLDACGIEQYEQVLVADVNNGNRFVTYALNGERGTGTVNVNGAGVHQVAIGDKIIIMAFDISDSVPDIKQILVDDNNKFLKFL